jgi:TM2 domain-containing membrane protein YozV
MRNIAAFFSILMPGIGQIYNRQILKGVIFVIFEHFDNIGAKINSAIVLDFNGQHQQALKVINNDYLLFYPGFYVYAVWDAWYFAKNGANKVTTAIPYIIAGFLGDFGVFFAEKIPFPAITTGILMLIPMIISMVIFRRQ